MTVQERPHPANIRKVNFTLDAEAHAWLAQRASSTRAYGHFISRLLHEDRVRCEERAQQMPAGPLVGCVSEDET